MGDGKNDPGWHDLGGGRERPYTPVYCASSYRVNLFGQGIHFFKMFMSDSFDLLSMIPHCSMVRWKCRGFSESLQRVNQFPEMYEYPGTTTFS